MATPSSTWPTRATTGCARSASAAAPSPPSPAPGAPGFSGDGGPGTGAQLNAPTGLAYDAEGKALYVADTNNNRVRLVEQSGVIATIAGTGVPGFSGDGGPASQAQLNAPVGIEYDVIAGDANRDLYVADTANHRVRKIDLAGGRISTVVGSGAAGFAGDGGQAGAASINAPRGVALDANGNLFVADTFNERVRRVANLSPIARFTATPVQGAAPLRLTVDATSSRDPQGGPLKYAWDFGEAGATAAGASAAHTYAGAGRYVVKLTVTDARGAVASASRAVFVGRPEERVPAAPSCAGPAVPEPPPAQEGEGEEPQVAIELEPGQLLINQRISQAAVRRANGIQAWLDAGIETRDICGERPHRRRLRRRRAAGGHLRDAVARRRPSPRPVVSKGPSGGDDEGARARDPERPPAPDQPAHLAGRGPAHQRAQGPARRGPVRRGHPRRRDHAEQAGGAHGPLGDPAGQGGRRARSRGSRRPARATGG